jgi:hypothetical protein
MGLDDLRLDRTATPTPAEPPPVGASSLRWIAVGAAGVIAGGLLTFWWMSRAQPDTAAPAPTTATEVAVGSNRPKRQFMDLPALDASDTWLANLVSGLSRHPTLARLLATPDLVRGTTLAVVQISEGRTPAVPLKVLRPPTRLQILGTTSGRLDAKSYARWETTTASLLSVPPADAAQLYVNVKPLFDQAYVELGHPGGDFDIAIVRAIGMLDDAPDQSEEPMLQRGSNYFEHQDPALRSLPPVQKQFLLIGADNRRKVMSWLQQFASSLDLKIN